nr:Rid family hydrolase [Formosimonas limnophila]
MSIQTFTRSNVLKPIGPYSHIAMSGPFINISGTPGVDPATGEMAGDDAYSQARQILATFDTLLASVGANRNDVMHIHVFFKKHSRFLKNEQSIQRIFSQPPTRPNSGCCVRLTERKCIDDNEFKRY